MSQPDIHLEFADAKAQSGLSVAYDEHEGSATVAVVGASRELEAAFTPLRIDEAHILYMEATEILFSRAKKGEPAEQIRAVLQQLFALYTK